MTQLSRQDYEMILGAILNCDLEYEHKSAAMEAFMRFGRDAPPPDPDFRTALTALINRYSKENDSDTPDFILATWLSDSLELFSRTVRRRDQWYGRGPKILPAPSESAAHAFWEETAGGPGRI